MTNNVIQIIEEDLAQGESEFNTITINANITGGTIENGQIIIDTPNLSIQLQETQTNQTNEAEINLGTTENNPFKENQ